MCVCVCVCVYTVTGWLTCLQASWRNWMHGTAKYEVLPEMKYSDILVPTIDTVRSAHIIGMLLDIKKPVSASSPWVSARRP